MKKSILYFIFSLTTLSSAISQRVSDYPYSDVSFTNVLITDKFWFSRIETLRNVTIPFAFQKCEETGRINNFAIAGGIMQGKFQSPYPFDDSDVYKIMEGASYLLAVKKDAKLDHYLDSLIYLISKAQEPDGYLFTNRTINNPLHPWVGTERWQYERDSSHELYNVGHMYEAAVAHFRATGKRTFLNIAIKNANLLCETFGPEKGKKRVAPGHEEVELALVKLFRVTGDIRYLNLSKFFLDARGTYDKYDKKSDDQFRNGAYWQDHLPVIQQAEAVGHAVRAPYMYSAMADIAALKKDSNYLKAIDKLWNNVVSKKLYITGGIGSTNHGEAFGKDYELPNSTAYCETCAAIANCLWNQRMFLLHGDAKYIDILERSLYNAVLSGIDLNGKKFFYPNVLACSKHGSERSEWFGCSCCPSNLSRFIPSVPGYFYAVSDKGIYVNLFGANTATVTTKTGNKIDLEQQTNYPWTGDIRLLIRPKKKEKFDIRIRIPGWASNKPINSDLYHYLNSEITPTRILINAKEVKFNTEKGYAILNKVWKSGDVISIMLPMTVNKVISNAKIVTNNGLVSVERGPIVYCAEFSDNKGIISNLILDTTQDVETLVKPNLFDGVTILKCAAKRVEIDNNKTIVTKNDQLTLIPYYARSHRGLGEMAVWLQTSDSAIAKSLKKELSLLDKVLVGDETSELAHKYAGENSFTGSSGLGSWRDARNGGWFSYNLNVETNATVELVVSYYSKDSGNREFEILVDNVKIAEQKLRAETFDDLVEHKYAIPANLVLGKKSITIMFKAFPGMIAGGIFGLHIQKAN